MKLSVIKMKRMNMMKSMDKKETARERKKRRNWMKSK